MNSEEKKRYNRHIILPEIGMEGQLLLKNSSVLVIGAGGLGCPVLQYLGAAGVGKIGIVDYDVVDESNLQRQILFTVHDIGKPKAEVAKARLLSNNPYINVEAIIQKIDKTNALEIIKDYDVVVDGSDNFATRYLINDACVLLSKPLVYGAIYKFEGQLSVFNYKNGPSYRCIFPEQPTTDSLPTCSQVGVLGVLPGIIGTMQANEAIKVILGREVTLSGRFLTVDILSNHFFELEIPRDDSNFLIKELGDYQDFCAFDSILEISVDELHENYEDYFVVDIRSKEERTNGMLPNAVSIEKDKLSDSISLLPRDKKILVYCHFGETSKPVVDLLRKNYGFNKVYNLFGGINDWSIEIDNSIIQY
jgi:sulfur-carrier protein adenylyltransferase/sulfurtransferase